MYVLFVLLITEITRARADPGFSVGGGADPPRWRGRPTYDFVKFSKKLHEIEKILGRRGVASPLRSATAEINQIVMLIISPKISEEGTQSYDSKYLH